MLEVANEMAALKQHVEALNLAIRTTDLTVPQARLILADCKEVEGWLHGIRKLLSV